MLRVMNAAAQLDPVTVRALRALADPARIRVLGLLLAGPAPVDVVATELRLPGPAVARAVDHLVAAGLAERREVGGRIVVAARAEQVGALGRALATIDGRGEDAEAGLRGAWPHDGEPPADTIARIAPDPEDAKVIRAYLVDGRLTTIPAQERKRAPILRFLRERVFTEDRDYPEKEVNQRLALFHRDVAALRRYLVDAGLVTRDDRGSAYRRPSRDPLRDPESPSSAGSMSP
jgi:hypothetical protein